jgi:hypothetical protein
MEKLCGKLMCISFKNLDCWFIEGETLHKKRGSTSSPTVSSNNCSDLYLTTIFSLSRSGSLLMLGNCMHNKFFHFLNLTFTSCSMFHILLDRALVSTMNATICSCTALNNPIMILCTNFSASENHFPQCR